VATALALAALLGGVAWPAELPDPESFALHPDVDFSGPTPVIHLRDAGAHQLTVQWIFETGASDDPAGQGGLAHLVEHLSFGPLGNGYQRQDYDEAIGEIGGESSGWTDRDRSGVGVTIPAPVEDDGASAWALALIEDARVNAPPPSADAVARQRQIITLEAAELRDRPHGMDRVWLDALLWSAGAPWARHPQDAPEGPLPQGAAAAELLRRFNGGGVVVMAGRLPAWTLQPVQPASVAPIRPPDDRECDPAAPARRWLRSNVAEGAVYFAWPTVPRSHPDRVPLEALARWMGGARVAAGRICGEFVVERRGGWWQVGEHARRLRRSLAAVARHGLPEDALRRLRAGQLTDLARGMAVLEVRARLAGSCLLSTGDPDCLPDEVRRWNALSPEAIRSAAARWLEWPAVTVLAVMPGESLLAPPIAGMRAG
jgi:zinc protease